MSFALDLRPHVPLLPPATIERARLTEALDRCTEHPFTLVGAPAGWGKTVLLGSWAAARGAAWLTVGARHLDGATFMADVERAIPGAGVPLVLDDVHRLRGGGLDVLREVVGAGAVVIVAACRVDPDLGLGRLRLDGRLAELRAADLAFTEEECSELLAAMGVHLGAAGVSRLVGRTEGWPAGLRLAGLSLAAEADPDAFVEEFAGDDGAVADYLTTEVLAGQPPRMRDFLLRTSLPDRLCGDLAAELTGAPDAALMLEQLAQGGMFLSPLDRRRTWFRYHGLFRELLRTRLRLEQPGTERELHARAAAWLAANGRGREAVAHALAAGDAGACDGLLAEQWLELLLDGWSTEVVAAAAERRRDPRLAVVAASGCLDRGDAAGATAWLDDAGGSEGDVGPLADLLRARVRSDVAAARAAASRLLARRPPAPAGATGAVAHLEVGLAEFASGSPEAAAEHFEAAAALAWETGADRVSLGSAGRSAALEAAAGRLVRAERAARTAIALAERRRRHRTAAAAWAYAALAAVHWHRNELDDAERRGDAAAAAAHASADGRALLAARALRAHLAGARGDAERARGLLGAVAGELPAAGPFLDRWTEALGPAVWAPPECGGPIAEATAWLQRGDPLAALRRTEPLAELGPAHPATALHAHLVTATARHALGRLDDASGSLERALAIANAEGYRRAFVAGLPVRRLLERHLDRPTAYGPLVVELLDALQRPHDPPVGLLEPLSDRERSVLRLLPTQLSYPEIGGELFVAANTVKTHVKSIYRKLDVASRREAVARARALRLL